MVLIPSLLLVIIFSTWFIYNSQQTSALETEKEVAKTETVENEKDIELNPFGNTVKKENIDSGQILGYIHRMSHQKVKAENKWGFYLITDERVNWLLEAVKQNQYYLMYGDQYEDILTRWSEGDFSQIDQDHNFVWKIQGGTKESEKATGILSEEEELEYINNTEDLQEAGGIFD